MFNTITYSLEDLETTLHPDRPWAPVLCEGCADVALYADTQPDRRFRKASLKAMAEGGTTYQVLDYYQVSTHGCRCCGTRDRGARYLVELRRAA